MDKDYFRELYAKFAGVAYADVSEMPVSLLLELERQGTLSRIDLLTRMRSSWRWLIQSILAGDSSSDASWSFLEKMRREIREHDGSEHKRQGSAVRLAEHGFKTLSKSDTLFMGYFGSISRHGKVVSTNDVAYVLILCTVPQNLLLTDDVAYGFEPGKALAGVRLAWKLWYELELYVAQQFDGVEEVPVLVRAN
jgi:hypothetical protein